MLSSKSKGKLSDVRFEGMNIIGENFCVIKSLRRSNNYIHIVSVNKKGEPIYLQKQGRNGAALWKLSDAINFLSLGYFDEFGVVKLCEMFPLDCSLN
jgi:hypothetical protein